MRDLTIDISKCLGIFLVVLGHCLHNDSAAHDVIYLFHMPLFFFLSGFFFREQDLLLFFRNKTKRLLYPFVFYYVFAKIWVIIHFIIVQRQLPTFDLDFFLSVGPIWFLISLWEIILLMNIVFRIKQDWVKSIIIIMFFTLGYYLSKENLSLPFFLTQSLIMLSFFYIGFIFRNKYFYKERSLYNLMTTGYFLRYIVVLVAFVWLLFLPHDRLDVYGMIFPSAMALIINALVGIVGIICLSSLIASSCVKYPRRRFLFGILQLGGVSSLHIMGLHYPLLITMFYMTIPLIIRTQEVLGIRVSEGYLLRYNTPLLTFTIALILTIISSYMGRWVENRFPRFFGK